VAEGEVEIRYVVPTHPSSEKVRFCHLRKDYFDDVIQVFALSQPAASSDYTADRLAGGPTCPSPEE
jgi:hypothetical protein